jgi:hypothetical protein
MGFPEFLIQMKRRKVSDHDTYQMSMMQLRLIDHLGSEQEPSMIPRKLEPMPRLTTVQMFQEHSSSDSWVTGGPSLDAIRSQVSVRSAGILILYQNAPIFKTIPKVPPNLDLR